MNSRISGWSTRLQWGHRLSAMETVEDRYSAWSVKHELQWGHRLSAMETWPVRALRRWCRWCFNGATAFRRWKRGLCGLYRRVCSRTAPRFNGATAFRRWKRFISGHIRARMLGLQWGHRLSAMETEEQIADDAITGDASMGPPPFGDGNSVTVPITVSAAYSLQWGHRLSAMESHPYDLPARQAVRASMGPPPFGDGKGYLRISSVVS